MGNVFFSKHKLFVCLCVCFRICLQVLKSMNVEKRRVPSLLFCVVCVFSCLLRLLLVLHVKSSYLVLVGRANVGARPSLGEITLWNTHKSHKALLLIMNIYDDGSSIGG